MNFIYVLKLLKHDITKEDEKIISKHYYYLKDKFENGKLVLVGPCLDKAFGIVIIETGSIEEAEEIMKNDPAVKQNLMKAELHPFNITFIKK